MGTPDRTPGPEFVEKLVFEDEGQTLDGAGQFFYDHRAGTFKARDATGIYDPRSGSGLSEAQHKGLRQLIHFIDDGPAEGFASGAYRETLPAGNPFPTSIIWWESSSKAQKIVELTITYSGAFPSTEVWKVYDEDGTTLLVTVTDTITYSGAFETSRARAIA